MHPYDAPIVIIRAPSHIHKRRTRTRPAHAQEISFYDFSQFISTLQPIHISRFLSEILTPSQCKYMLQRYAISLMLFRGCSRHDIQDSLGVSTSTIHHVSRNMHNFLLYKQIRFDKRVRFDMKSLP